MKWHFHHSDLSVNEINSKINSSTTVEIEMDGVKMTLYNSVTPEEHVVGTRKALVDSGNMLRRIGLEMLRRAEKIK